MTAIENIRDIFSILHDGIIIGYAGDRNLMTLKVDCEYLAKRINKSFDNFYIDLIQVDNLHFITWPNPFNLPARTLTELNDIFKANLIILYADIKEEAVVVSCNQNNENFDYCGGYLTISCKEIKIYDQNKNELTITTLDNICKSYWDEL